MKPTEPSKNNVLGGFRPEPRLPVLVKLPVFLANNYEAHSIIGSDLVGQVTGSEVTQYALCVCAFALA